MGNCNQSRGISLLSDIGTPLACLIHSKLCIFTEHWITVGIRASRSATDNIYFYCGIYSKTAENKRNRCTWLLLSPPWRSNLWAEMFFITSNNHVSPTVARYPMLAIDAAVTRHNEWEPHNLMNHFANACMGFIELMFVNFEHRCRRWDVRISTFVKQEQRFIVIVCSHSWETGCVAMPMNMIIMDIPVVQVRRSALRVYPSKQEQLKPPSVFVHWWSHPAVRSAHSSISVT